MSMNAREASLVVKIDSAYVKYLNSQIFKTKVVEASRSSTQDFSGIDLRLKDYHMLEIKTRLS